MKSGLEILMKWVAQHSIYHVSLTSPMATCIHTKCDIYIYIYIVYTEVLILVKQCHKQPMTGNGKHTTNQKADDWVMVNL